MSPEAPCLRCRTARRAVPTSEAVRVWDAGSCSRLAKARRAPGVGRCLRQRQRLWCRTARRSVPTSEAVRVWDAGSCCRLTQARGAPGVGRFSPTAPCLRCRTARRSVPTSEAVRVWDAGSCCRLTQARGAPGVGRCLRQRHVCGAGPLGDRSLPGGASGRNADLATGWPRPGELWG